MSPNGRLRRSRSAANPKHSRATPSRAKSAGAKFVCSASGAKKAGARKAASKSGARRRKPAAKPQTNRASAAAPAAAAGRAQRTAVPPPTKGRSAIGRALRRVTRSVTRVARNLIGAAALAGPKRTPTRLIAPPGVAVTGRMGSHYADVLTTETLAFLAELHRKFDARRRDLLAARREQQRRYDAGELPDFLPETQALREGEWKIAGIPTNLPDRRVEITGRSIAG